jgi:hypothetical protein
LPIQLRAEIERKFKNHEFTCEKELTMSIISGKYKIVPMNRAGRDPDLRKVVKVTDTVYRGPR